MVADSAKGPRPSLTETLFALFLRLVAVASLWFALQYWAMLTGFSFDGRGRFDLLPPAWKAASTVLAVLFPVAAVGLWLLVSWGPVIWLLAAATEIAMHEVYPSIFGINRLLVVTHLAVAAVFVLFRIASSCGSMAGAGCGLILVFMLLPHCFVWRCWFVSRLE